MQFSKFFSYVSEALNFEQPLDASDPLIELMVKDNQVFMSLDDAGDTFTLSAPIGTYEGLSTDTLVRLAQHNARVCQADDFACGGYSDVGLFALSKRFVLADDMVEPFADIFAKLPQLLDNWRDWFVQRLEDEELLPPLLADVDAQPEEDEAAETEEGAAEEQRADYQEKALAVIAQLDELLISADMDPLVPYANVRVLEVFGYPLSFVADDKGLGISAERPPETTQDGDPVDPVTHSLGVNFLLGGTSAQLVWPTSSGALSTGWYLPAQALSIATLEAAITAVANDMSSDSEVLASDDAPSPEHEALLGGGYLNP